MELAGIGNALMDVLCIVETEFISSLGVYNNSTAHLPPENLSRILPFLPEPCFVAGGGALNVARLASMLGIQTRFAGATGNDRFGAMIRADLENAGVEALISVKDGPSGVFIALNTPEETRSILVFPGVAQQLSENDIPDSFFEPGVMLHLEGFLAWREGFFMSCLERAQRAGMPVSLDGSGFSLISSHRSLFLDVARRFCSLIFLNEDEALALVGGPVNTHSAADIGCDLVIKRAERGAVFVSGTTILESPVRAQAPFDETGAGDAFAAGFLSGRIRGMRPDRCLRLGNRIAEEIIQVPLCQINPVLARSVIRSVS
jgi:sugar/nucleoside kinase (ribokinase family)